MFEQEGNVRIETIKRISIGDKPLNKCTEQEITKEIMALCSRISQLRAEVERLEKVVSGAAT